KAKKAGKTKEASSGSTTARDANMPKNALGIMDTSSGQVARIERVKSFQVPEDGSGFISYLLEPKGSGPAAKVGAKETSPEAPNATPLASPSPAPKDPQSSRAQSSGALARGSGRATKKEYGSDLVLRNMTTGAERTFNDVLDYTLSKDANTLI